MANAETRILTGSEILSFVLPSLEIASPKIYKAKDVDVAKGVLSVALAGESVDLPIEEKNGVKFTWVDPADPNLRRLGAIETGLRLHSVMKNHSAIMMEMPSDKSNGMSEDAGSIAAKLSHNEVYVVKLGGGLMDQVEPVGPPVKTIKDYFSQDIINQLKQEELKPGQMTSPLKALNKDGEEAFVIRYMPITGKDKFMFMTATQWLQMKIRIDNGEELTTIEDVVSFGTTINACKALLKAWGIKKDLWVIALAKEGDWYKGQIDYAIGLPDLMASEED